MSTRAILLRISQLEIILNFIFFTAHDMLIMNFQLKIRPRTKRRINWWSLRKDYNIWKENNQVICCEYRNFISDETCLPSAWFLKTLASKSYSDEFLDPTKKINTPSLFFSLPRRALTLNNLKTPTCKIRINQRLCRSFRATTERGREVCY